MKIVAGEGKKRAPAEGESGGSAQIVDAPTKILNTHRTDTPQHNTTGDPAQGGLGQGGGSLARRSLARRSMTPKSRHEQQILPKSSPIGQGFSRSRMALKGLGTKRFDQKKGPRGGLGQEWSEKPKNMEKQIKNLSPNPEQKHEKSNIEKNPQNQKNGTTKISLLLPPRPKNQKINNKIKNCKNVQRKKINSKYCSNKKKFQKKIRKMFCFFDVFCFFFLFDFL